MTDNEEFMKQAMDTLLMLHPGLDVKAVSHVLAQEQNKLRVNHLYAVLLGIDDSATPLSDDYVAEVKKYIWTPAIFEKDVKAPRDEAGLTPCEALTLCEALPTLTGYSAMTEESHPELSRKFDELCKHAAKSGDKYVKRYLAKHKGEPLKPRVLVVDDDEAMAAAVSLPWKFDPIIYITTGLIGKQSIGEVLNTMRHELGHLYKTAHDVEQGKKERNCLPFVNPQHVEETRADLFAPRTGDDLRKLATSLSKFSNGFDEQSRLRVDAVNIIRQHGGFKRAGKLMSEQGHKVGSREERQNLREQYYWQTTAEQSSIIDLKEDGSFSGGKKHTDRNRKTPHYPSYSQRIERLENEGDKLDAKLGITSKPKPTARGGSHSEAIDAEIISETKVQR